MAASRGSKRCPLAAPAHYFLLVVLLPGAEGIGCQAGDSPLIGAFSTSSSSSATPGQGSNPSSGPAATLPSSGHGWHAAGLIDNNGSWRDDQGRTIALHGHGVIRDGDEYWLYGIDGKGALGLYHSATLSGWTAAPSLPLSASLAGGEKCDGAQTLSAPTIVYNSTTDNFVLMGRAVAGASVATIAVATSEHAAGPYKFVRCLAPGRATNVKSFAVFSDSTNAGYVVSSSTVDGTATISIDGLDASFTELARPALSQAASEALPRAAFVDGGVFYLVGLTGQKPAYAAATSIDKLAHAAWSPLFTESSSGFGVQPAHFFKPAGTWFFQGERSDGTMVWLPMEAAHFTGLPGSIQTGSLSLLWRDSVQIDTAAGVWREGPRLLTLAAADWKSSAETWPANDQVITSPNAVSISLALEGMQKALADGVIHAGVDPGSAKHFAFVIRFAGNQDYSSVVYDHGSWYASNGQGTRKILASDVILPTGVFTPVTVSWRANLLGLTVDGVQLFNAPVDLSSSNGSVGLQGWADGTFRVSDMQVMSSGTFWPVYETVFEYGMSGMQASGGASWTAAPRVLTGKAAAAGALVDTHAPAQQDGTVAVAVAADSSNWGVIFRFTNPKDFAAITFGPQGLGWLVSGAAGQQRGTLDPAVKLPSGATASVSVEVIENLLTVAIDGHRVYRGSLGSLPMHAGRVGLWVDGGGQLSASGLRTASAYASAMVLDDSAFAYTLGGDWYWNPEGDAYLNQYHWCATTGEGFTVTFTGSQMSLAATVAGDHGIMSSAVDGKATQDVDLWAAERRSMVQVYTVKNLSLAEHRAHFAVSGRRNPKASGPWAIADQAVVPRQVDDIDLAVRYSRDWQIGVSAKDTFGGTVSQSSTAGASASLTFFGTGVNIFGPLQDDGGPFDIVVDGMPQSGGTTLGRAMPQGLIGSVSGLSWGEHTIRCTVKATELRLDAFEVILDSPGPKGAGFSP